MSEHMPMPAYPGYPTKRLVIENINEDTNLTLPDGEWSTGVHVFPSEEKQQELRNQGYELDGFGRPLHPWLREMLTNPEVGVLTGMGKFWNWGPNRAADPIVINTDEDPKVLLIKRGDTGAWALPGGFIDTDENGVDAARRELFEEAGLIINDEPITIYNGVVADARATAHAWPETVAVLWRIHGTPSVSGNDDAIDAKWFPLSALPFGIHGSHAALIEQAALRLDEQSSIHIPSFPESIESYEIAEGGHMAYTRLLATTRSGSKLFIKSHDKQAFTDADREAHSRLYLQKEKLLYDHMTLYEYAHIPDTVTLISDHTLSMRALTNQDGWHWRAPKEDIDRYVTDIFLALERLEEIPLPYDFLDNKGPVCEMLYRLGWDDIDPANGHTQIQKTLEKWHTKFGERFVATAENLAVSIHTLRDSALQIQDLSVLSHHDLRQSNIAWHPEHGARIVDWSWAGTGPKNGDATMLIIDLHKSGHDMTDYMERFNPEYARLMIGFWLRHCQMEAREANGAVRFHQALSAVCAYDLLMKYGKR